MPGPVPLPLSVWATVLGLWTEERFTGVEAWLALVGFFFFKYHLSHTCALHSYGPNFKYPLSFLLPFSILGLHVQQHVHSDLSYIGLQNRYIQIKHRLVINHKEFYFETVLTHNFTMY